MFKSIYCIQKTSPLWALINNVVLHFNVCYFFSESDIYWRKWELRNKNNRLRLCSAQASRQPASEDALLHPTVRRPWDPQIRRLRWVMWPLEPGGHTGKSRPLGLQWKQHCIWYLYLIFVSKKTFVQKCKNINYYASKTNLLIDLFIKFQMIN